MYEYQQHATLIGMAAWREGGGHGQSTIITIIICYSVQLCTVNVTA